MADVLCYEFHAKNVSLLINGYDMLTSTSVAVEISAGSL